MHILSLYVYIFSEQPNELEACWMKADAWKWSKHDLGTLLNEQVSSTWYGSTFEKVQAVTWKEAKLIRHDHV